MSTLHVTFAVDIYSSPTVIPALEQGSRATSTTLVPHGRSWWKDLVCCPGSLLEGRDDSRGGQGFWPQTHYNQKVTGSG